jgi:hypothetical protein
VLSRQGGIPVLDDGLLLGGDTPFRIGFNPTSHTLY